MKARTLGAAPTIVVRFESRCISAQGRLGLLEYICAVMTNWPAWSVDANALWWHTPGK